MALSWRPRLPALSWRPRGAVADVLVALAVAAVMVLYPLVSRTDLAPMWPYGHLLLVLATAVLLLRRWQPVPVLVAVLGMTLLYFAGGYPEVPIYVACIVALYTVADRTHPLIALAFGAVAIAGAAWQEITTAMPPGDLLMITGWLLMVIAFGAAARSRRAYVAVAERRAVIEERLRIARDVHDAVGHAMSLINVQAGAALHRIGDRPEKAEEALATIKQASAQALRELRATVGELRHDPGTGDIGRLVDNARQAGLEVRLRQPHEARLRPEVDLAAYRIVQEALTNTARHAGATRVSVELAMTDGELTISIEDDGTNGSGGPPGSGLTGMAERVESLGGTLRYGPREGKGFRVLARLPAGDGAGSR
ncbi:sensor histidine kinase [Nonomuraea basaltis]|uniref:sensor histidine kinase n=1 Tax=Nonomuraea basaltis TaxID=2495887 RepID=UPI00110C6CD3|nr:sensor histidine kinase [Nonomuraea basaltis]TMR92220.1 sensor histidine kinase [Nonomuraea basaltis]